MQIGNRNRNCNCFLFFASAAKANRYLKPAAVIKTGLMCLYVLLVTRDFINPVAFTESGSGLMIGEGNAVFHALQMCVQDPS